MIEKIIRYSVIPLAVLLRSPFVIAQPIPQQLQAYAQELRVSQSASVPAALREEKNAKEIIESASSYFSDTLSHLRAEMYRLTEEVGAQSQDPQLRKLAVENLVNATSDFENLDALFSTLSAFHPSDFTQAPRDTLTQLFAKKPPYLDQLVRLAGTLQLNELTEDLKTLSGTTTTNQRLRWSALVALARMGNSDATQSMMTRVRRLGVNDDLVYEVFPDLVYTRQRQAIDYLVTELNNDEKKCFTADAEDETPITCAYRIMEMLAPAIDNYPLQKDASGDIKTKDYQKSLNEVRSWFQKNKNYKIVE